MDEDNGAKKLLYKKFKSLEISKLFFTTCTVSIASDTLRQISPLQGQSEIVS
jgi:hypothetical protein